MKKPQYIIQKIDNGLPFQWEEQTILFDTQEEAEELIQDCGDFFSNPLNIEIKKGLYFIDNSINYKTLCNIIAYRQVVRLYDLKKGGQYYG